MADWYNELRFNSADYYDIQVIDTVQMAIDYAYKNYI
jgi:hypothetical protein